MVEEKKRKRNRGVIVITAVLPLTVSAISSFKFLLFYIAVKHLTKISLVILIVVTKKTLALNLAEGTLEYGDIFSIKDTYMH